MVLQFINLPVSSNSDQRTQRCIHINMSIGCGLRPPESEGGDLQGRDLVLSLGTGVEHDEWFCLCSSSFTTRNLSSTSRILFLL